MNSTVSKNWDNYGLCTLTVYFTSIYTRGVQGDPPTHNPSLPTSVGLGGGCTDPRTDVRKSTNESYRTSAS